MSNSDDRQLLGKLTEAVISDPTQGPRASKAVARQVWRQRTAHWGSFFDKWSTGTTYNYVQAFFCLFEKIRKFMRVQVLSKKNPQDFFFFFEKPHSNHFFRFLDPKI